MTFAKTPNVRHAGKIWVQRMISASWIVYSFFLFPIQI